MTDSSTQSFRDLAQKAIEESTVTETVAEPTPEPEVEAKAETTPEPEESFAQKGELKGRTAEELEEIYQNWNKSYTQKRQSETQELKQLREERDQLTQRLQSLEGQSSSNPQHVAAEYQGEQDELVQLLQTGQITPADYHQRLQTIIQSQARAIARQEFENLSSEHDENSRQQLALSEVNSLDDRFNSNAPMYDKAMHRAILADVGEELDAYLANNNGSSQGFDHKAVANRLISEWNERIDAQVKARTQQSTQVARDAAGKFAKQNPKSSPAQSVTTEGKSLRDLLTEEVSKRL